MAAGADAPSLIVAALEDAALRSLLDLSKHLRIAALVEVHTEDELKRAVDAGRRSSASKSLNLRLWKRTWKRLFRFAHEVTAGAAIAAQRKRHQGLLRTFNRMREAVLPRRA